MPTIADYSVALDSAVNLQVDTPQSFPFSLTNDADLGTSGVCMLRMHAHNDPNNLEFDILINGIPLYTHPFGVDSRSCQTIHEVIESGLLRHGNNNVTVRAFGPNATVRGTMTLSDIVIFFQRNI